MLDTLKIASTLKGSGFSAEQAEGVAAALATAIQQGVPTKLDFTDLERDFAKLEGKVEKLGWMVGVNIALTVAVLLKLFVG